MRAHVYASGCVYVWLYVCCLTTVGVVVFVADPHYKNRPLMTLQKWAIFIMRVYGESSHFLSDPAEISFLTT